MRIQKPKPFDPKKEYKIGERCIYNGMILILKKWTNVDPDFIIKYKIPIEMASRCLSCRIKPDVCTGAHLQCDKFNRKDRKNTYWCFVRVIDGFKKKEVFSYGFDGQISGIRIEVEKT